VISSLRKSGPSRRLPKIFKGRPTRLTVAASGQSSHWPTSLKTRAHVRVTTTGFSRQFAKATTH